MAGNLVDADSPLSSAVLEIPLNNYKVGVGSQSTRSTAGAMRVLVRISFKDVEALACQTHNPCLRIPNFFHGVGYALDGAG